MSQRTIYKIRDWNDHFENNRTRELKTLAWVPMPNRHDGDGYTELMDHPKAASHYGAWCAIVQVASKCDPRGTLVRDGAKPHDSGSLSRITRIPKSVFDEALPRLLEIGWLEAASIDHDGSCDDPAGGCGIVPTAPQEGAQKRKERNGIEMKGKEGKGKEQCAADAASQVGAGDVRSVFEHYRTYHPKAHPKPASTSKEWRLILARFAEGYSVDDLCLAIDGNHRSPFHCGENERGKQYQSLELIVRDSSHVTQFMELATDNRPVLSEKTQRTKRAMDSYLERRVAEMEAKDGIHER